MLRGSTPPRVAKDKNIPDIVPTGTIDDNDKRNTPSRNTRSQSTSLIIMEEVMLSSCQMSSTSYQIDPQKSAIRKYLLQLFCEIAGAVLDEETGDCLEYHHLVKHPNHQKVWGGAFGKEVGRLAQGLPGIVEGTETLNFIFKHEIPSDRFKDVTYACIVCNSRPEKKYPSRWRITVGGNMVNYPGDCVTPTADLLTVKLLLNSVISTEGARFMILDILNFYLMTPIKRKEYVKMKLSDFLESVISH